MKRNTLFSYVIIILAYLLAIYVGKTSLYHLDWENPYLEMLMADIMATLVVFLFSFLFNNSSVYDPYWSVIPVPIALYWISMHPEGLPARQWLIMGVILIWSLRLTINWMKSWSDLTHEDWRYRMLAEKSGKFYWLVSLTGIHLFPTLMVFLGILPVLPAVSSSKPLSFFDILGAIIALTAVIIEYVADEQLRQFKRTNRQKGANMEAGIWSISRHPNYLGEILFWMGLFFFAVSAGLSTYYWTGIGFVAMLLLFYFISIPMMEERLIKTKTGYPDYIVRVPRLIPGLIVKRDRSRVNH